MKRLAAPLIALVAIAAFAAAPTVHAAPDPARYALTPQMIQKLKSAEGDMAKLAARDDKDEDLSDMSVEQAARAIDSDPARKAVLARHGLSGLDLALSAHAMLHAGTYLMYEKQLDKAKLAQLYGSYTAEQRANIELLRKTAGASR